MASNMMEWLKDFLAKQSDDDLIVAPNDELGMAADLPVPNPASLPLDEYTVPDEGDAESSVTP